jgi:6-phosphogluconolactonase
VIRFRLVALACAACLGLAALLPASRAEDKTPRTFMVYFGTYTGKNSEGIYRCELDVATGKLSEAKLAGKAVNPSFLAIHPTGKYLYAVGEADKMGGVSAFALDQKTGDLTLLNSQSSEGAGPCYVSLSKKGTYAFVANYSGGNACALPIGKDGQLAKATSVTPVRKDENKKKRPLGHSINLDAADKFAFVGDAGLDKVWIYKFADGKLTPNDPPYAALPDKAAPRHFSFHPNGKWAYVINESAMSVTAFDYDAKKGELKEIHTVSSIPGEKKDGYSTAEVVVHPSGKFVYGSNRGQNSIAVFSVDQKTGKLTRVQNQGKNVKTPRNFAIDPTGKYCLVANQDGGNVIVFKVDQEAGKLEPTDYKVEVSNPVCVRFLAWPRS